MPTERAVLVLHGISMSGASMLRTLGLLRTRLEESGLSLIAPNAGHRMAPDELTSLGAWLDGTYQKMGQNAGDWFRHGRFWDAGEHHDWFQATTDPETGKKTYLALANSLDAIAGAIRDRRVVGVVGFSQGASMAIIVAALALQGDARFKDLAWGVFISGFKPVFDQPKLVTYPAAGNFSGMFVLGDKDPLFPGGSQHLASLASAFDSAWLELVLVHGLGHDVPADPDIVERIARFASTH